MVSIYTTNLQEPLQIDVEMWRPGSLLDAMSLARSCERHANWAPLAGSWWHQGAEEPSRWQNHQGAGLFQRHHWSMHYDGG